MRMCPTWHYGSTDSNSMHSMVESQWKSGWRSILYHFEWLARNYVLIQCCDALLEGTMATNWPGLEGNIGDDGERSIYMWYYS